MADGNSLDIHFEFDDPSQKEAFKTAFQGWVKQYEKQALAGGGGAGLAAGERIGTAPRTSGGAAGIGISYLNFIPRW